VTDTEYLTTTEAAALCRYSRSDTFLRAYRAKGFTVYKARGICLVLESDLRDFLSRNPPQSTTTNTVPRGT